MLFTYQIFQMVIHVSTAYCYPGHTIVEEKVGAPDIQWINFIDNVKNWSSDMPTSVTSRLLVCYVLLMSS